MKVVPRFFALRTRNLSFILTVEVKRNRVAFEDVCASFVALDEFAAVVRHDRFGRSDAGQDRFAAAREAGEEVGFDEAFGDEEVGVDGSAVDEQLAARRQQAEVCHGRVVL